ncbi:GNAT family N-acetyltransferase [Winogradskyella sp.]|uniref:GNAT family N-acetyltransferase n=1 Tax=Winogradskyella sp. TaxID=1883156 RepID=UPI00261F268D|nr:GNAT family N-acetyltransferase [Winogradskyella sp.]
MTASTSFQTRRLFIRPITIEDASFVLELMNTPLWIQFIGDRNVRTIEEAEAYIKEKAFAQMERYGYTNNVVIRKEDNTKLGTCGIYHREGKDIPDIGFAFLPNYHGRGYAFESASKLIQVAYRNYGLNELSGYTLEENLASKKTSFGTFRF